MVSSREEGERLLRSENLKQKGYVVKEGVKKLPMMMVYYIVKIPDEKDVKELQERNFEDMSEQEFLRASKVKRKIKQAQDRRSKEKEEKKTWIVEASCEVFKKSMARGRMYLEWEAVKVKEYLDVVRCFKCQGYGQVGKVCSEKKDTCGRCVGSHRTEKCEV